MKVERDKDTRKGMNTTTNMTVEQEHEQEHEHEHEQQQQTVINARINSLKDKLLSLDDDIDDADIDGSNPILDLKEKSDNFSIDAGVDHTISSLLSSSSSNESSSYLSEQFKHAMAINQLNLKKQNYAFITDHPTEEDDDNDGNNNKNSRDTHKRTGANTNTGAAAVNKTHPSFHSTFTSNTYAYSFVTEQTDTRAVNDNMNDNGNENENENDAHLNPDMTDMRLDSNTDMETHVDMDTNIDENDRLYQQMHGIGAQAQHTSRTPQQTPDTASAAENITNKKTKSAKVITVSYTSARLTAGLTESIYDSDRDRILNMFRFFTFLPLTVGAIWMPMIVIRYPEWDLVSKAAMASFYVLTSMFYPMLAYRATRDVVTNIWITANCETLIVEKTNFFFQLYKQEYSIAELKILYRKGSNRHVWIQCKRSQRRLLLLAERLQHPVWFQILGIDPKQMASVKHDMLAHSAGKQQE